MGWSILPWSSSNYGQPDKPKRFDGHAFIKRVKDNVEPTNLTWTGSIQDGD